VMDTSANTESVREMSFRSKSIIQSGHSFDAMGRPKSPSFNLWHYFLNR
jgi:hypothetical protein